MIKFTNKIYICNDRLMKSKIYGKENLSIIHIVSDNFTFTLIPRQRSVKFSSDSLRSKLI